MRGFAYQDLNGETLAADIRSARDAGADMVIACVHWGHERVTHPNESQIRLAEELVSAGADIVLGHHPHVSQKVQWVESGGNRGLVFYSLSNFISNMYAPQADTGYIAYLTIVKDGETGAVSLEDASYLPAIVYKKTYLSASEWDFRVLPMAAYLEDEALLATLDAAMRKRLRDSYEETLKIVGDAIRVTKDYPG